MNLPGGQHGGWLPEDVLRRTSVWTFTGPQLSRTATANCHSVPGPVSESVRVTEADRSILLETAEDALCVCVVLWVAVTEAVWPISATPPMLSVPEISLVTLFSHEDSRLVESEVVVPVVTS